MAKKLRILVSFKKDYQKLPQEIREKVDKQLAYLVDNPEHPSLKLHPIKGTKAIWEGYVDYHYRFTFEVEGQYFLLRKVGTHDILKKP